jgi:hypothetical protein
MQKRFGAVGKNECHIVGKANSFGRDGNQKRKFAAGGEASAIIEDPWVIG